MPNTLYKTKFYKSSDYSWYRYVEQIDAKIRKLELCIASGIFCDKWGEPLNVGDKVTYTNRRDRKVAEGTIKEINGQLVLMEDGTIVHWNYLVKEEK